MNLFDAEQQTWQQSTAFPKGWLDKKDYFVMCSVSDMPTIQDAFNLDDSTVRDCTDLDESVRFSSFQDYDFISMVLVDAEHQRVVLQEVNLYVSYHYLIMVLPDHPKTQAKHLEEVLTARISELKGQDNWLNRLLYMIFNVMMADCSEVLERLEDELEGIQEQVIHNVDKKQYQAINAFRKMTYTIKKQLRASSYLGEQILVNANGLISKSALRYFQNVDARLRKLYDFAESLNDFSNQLLDAYDTRLAAKTNEAVNKLTIITVFFGPLTVITGIYGMNFTHMPELNWWFGYPAVLCTMALITIVVYLLLKKFKWL